MKLGVEIGAGDPKSSFLFKNKDYFDEIVLFEPNNILFNELKSIQNDKIKIYNKVLGGETKQELFYTLGQSSFLKGAKSFLNLAHDENPEEYLIKFAKQRNVETLMELETRHIDFLNLTCNGSELDVLYGMVGRPTIIRIVLYIHNNRHGEYARQLFNCLLQSGYKIVKQNTNKLNTYLETFLKHG